MDHSICWRGSLNLGFTPTKAGGTVSHKDVILQKMKIDTVLPVVLRSPILFVFRVAKEGGRREQASDGMSKELIIRNKF